MFGNHVKIKSFYWEINNFVFVYLTIMLLLFVLFTHQTVFENFGSFLISPFVFSEN